MNVVDKHRKPLSFITRSSIGVFMYVLRRHLISLSYSIYYSSPALIQIQIIYFGLLQHMVHTNLKSKYN